MGHLKYDKTTRAEKTDPVWLGVGAQIGQLANILSGRSDLVAYVGPGAGGEAPACYTPATAEVEVNVDAAFGRGTTPADIGDLRERATQFEWPKAMGAIFHEALHARLSNWDIPKAYSELEHDEFMSLLLLEEGRIEAAGVRMMPENAGFLRASALGLVLYDLAEEGLGESDTQMAARLAALALARVDAGVLEEEDVEMLRATITSKISDEKLEQLRQIWIAVQQYESHYDAAGMYDLAREWARIVRETAEENGDPAPGEGEMSGGIVTPGGEAGSGASEFVKSLIEELNDAADAAAIGAYDQLDEQQTAEEWRDEAKSRNEQAKQEREHQQEASDVFGKGTGPSPECPSWSQLSETRDPKSEERAAAVKVAQMLDKAKYRDRDETEIHSIVPPGRLRTRALVQNAALRDKGVMTQAEPWRRTKRKQVDDPTLTIGVMVDISGSMSDAMQPMATTAWVMSEAVRRVQGKCAMVYYGQGVFPTLKPGQHLDKVNVYTAPDSTEKFDKAFKAIDGGLGLLNGSGARLLVVVSDGHYTSEERRAARKWVDACGQRGVGVLWLTFDEGREAERLTVGSTAVVMKGITTPTDVATEIGAAAAKALTAVG